LAGHFFSPGLCMKMAFRIILHHKGHRGKT